MLAVGPGALWLAVGGDFEVGKGVPPEVAVAALLKPKTAPGAEPHDGSDELSVRLGAPSQTLAGGNELVTTAPAHGKAAEGAPDGLLADVDAAGRRGNVVTPADVLLLPPACLAATEAIIARGEGSVVAATAGTPPTSSTNFGGGFGDIISWQTGIPSRLASIMEREHTRGGRMGAPSASVFG